MWLGGWHARQATFKWHHVISVGDVDVKGDNTYSYGNEIKWLREFMEAAEEMVCIMNKLSTVLIFHCKRERV